MLISPSSATNSRQARRAMFVADFAQLFLDDGENALLFRQNVAQIFDRLDQLLVFLVDLFALESGQLIQAKIEDLVGLVFAEGVAAIRQARLDCESECRSARPVFGEFEGEQFHSRFVAIGRSANDADEFIEIRQRDEITFERFGALLRFAQFEARPAQNDFAAMLDVSGVRLLERKQFRPAVIDREHDDRERAFHRGVLVEIVDDDLRIRVALQLDNDPRVFIRLIANGS